MDLNGPVPPRPLPIPGLYAGQAGATLSNGVMWWGAMEPAGHLPLSPMGCLMSPLRLWPFLPWRPAAEAELGAAEIVVS